MARDSITRATIAIVLWFLTAIWASPVLWMAMISLRTTEEFYKSPYALPIPAHWDKFASAWFDFGYQTYFVNSAIVCLGAVAILVFVGSLAAFYFARYNFRYKEVLYMAIFASIMLPPQITILALFEMLVGYGLYNSLTGLILVYAASHLPLTLYLLRNAFAQIPHELEEAARIDGASDFAIFWRIMFPIARPAVVVVTIINFIEFWNEFLYAVVLVNEQGKRTLPLAVMFFVGEQYENVGMLATGLMIATVPILIVYGFFSERITKSLTSGALAGT